MFCCTDAVSNLLETAVHTTWLKSLVASFAGLLIIARTFEESCSELASKVDFPDVQVQFAEYVPSGTNLTFPYDVC
jgi:hypothetical protein